MKYDLYKNHTSQKDFSNQESYILTVKSVYNAVIPKIINN